MRCEEAEQYLYYAMTIGEQLLISGAEVGRVEDTIRRICMAYGAERVLSLIHISRAHET